MIVLGTRPDIIRASKIITLLDQSKDVELHFIWSGQHYSENMKDIFFKQLCVRQPDIELGIEVKSDGQFVGELIKNLHKIFKQLKPAAAIFLGDTNTVAGCIAAAQLNIPIIHIEGCMRSYDWRMPEEKYRTVIDHLSDVIYAYLENYKEIGVLEGIYPKRIIVTGNPIVDIINNSFINKIDENVQQQILDCYSVTQNNYIVMTCHRRENIDEEYILKNIMKLAGTIEKKVLFFAGYLTQRRLEEYNMVIPDNVDLFDPIGYQEILYLIDASEFVVTDSGTITEESCVLGIPSIQIRYSTERPEVYDVSSSVRFNPREVNIPMNRYSNAIEQVRSLSGKQWPNPLGDGQASKRIVSDIITRLKTSSLMTHQPYSNIVHIQRSMNG